MKELTDKYFAVEVDNDVIDCRFNIGGNLLYPMLHGHATTHPIELDGSYDLLFLSNRVTEEHAANIVHKGGIGTYRDYVYASEKHEKLDEVGLFNALLEMKFKTAIESFNSLLKSKGLDTDKNYAIIEKTN